MATLRTLVLALDMLAEGCTLRRFREAVVCLDFGHDKHLCEMHTYSSHLTGEASPSRPQQMQMQMQMRMHWH
jgi:hypothetical protein